MKPIKVLLFANTGIGDAVLLIPLLLSIKKNIPSCSIYVLSDNKYGAADVLSCYADYVINTIENEKYDYIINPLFGGISLFKLLKVAIKRFYLNEKFISHVVIKKSLKTLIFIYFLNLFRIKTIDFKTSIHQIMNNLNLISICKLEEKNLIYNPTFPSNYTKNLAINAKEKFNLPNKFAVIQVGAANNSLTPKKWPLEYWEDLIHKISKDFFVVILGDKNETVHIQSNGNILNLIGKTDIYELIGILTNSDFTIGVDSGITHLSSALNIKTLVLWGPTAFSISRQIGQKTIFESLFLPCSPCTSGSFLKPESEALKACQFNNSCMKNIKPMTVYNKFLMKWNEHE